YTSGSTGTPKGVLGTNSCLVNLADWQANEYSKHASRVGQMTNISFDVSIQEILFALTCRAPLAIPPEDTQIGTIQTSKWLSEKAVGNIFMPTSLMNLLSESIQDVDADDIAITDIFQGGEPLKLTKSVRDMLEIGKVERIHNHYGACETHNSTSFTAKVADLSDGPLVPAGRPIQNVQIYVLDGTLNPVPPGTIGEIYAAGAGTARGYLGRPVQTAERFIANPADTTGGRLYRTGDTGYFDRKGQLVVLGRADRQIKINGARVELGEIEAALQDHPSVRRIVVAMREGKNANKVLVAYYVPDEDAGIDQEVLRTFARKRLPTFMLPSQFVEIDAVPLSPNGKLLLEKLPVPDVTQQRKSGPISDEERKLAGVFCDILGVDHVGLDESFFQLGGHSLLAIKAINRIKQKMGRNITVRQFFMSPTVSALAGELKSAKPVSRPQLVKN
ncbi:non-ribosomal peptide synthetase, partial [Tateyamaria omphalii]|uniref:non-ribosomal peptide synthetase n=1 Tax=Tateyamaria omphalii TaxID=299262 RepID=UPI0016794291